MLSMFYSWIYVFSSAISVVIMFSSWLYPWTCLDDSWMPSLVPAGPAMIDDAAYTCKQIWTDAHVHVVVVVVAVAVAVVVVAAVVVVGDNDAFYSYYHEDHLQMFDLFSYLTRHFARDRLECHRLAAYGCATWLEKACGRVGPKRLDTLELHLAIS